MADETRQWVELHKLADELTRHLYWILHPATYTAKIEGAGTAGVWESHPDAVRNEMRCTCRWCRTPSGMPGYGRDTEEWRRERLPVLLGKLQAWGFDLSTKEQ